MPFESSENVSLGASLGNTRVPGVPPQGLPSHTLMPWLGSRWVIILGPFGVLQAHVVDGTPFGRYRPIRILLRNTSQGALGDSRTLQYLLETGNGRVYEQHGHTHARRSFLRLGTPYSDISLRYSASNLLTPAKQVPFGKQTNVLQFLHCRFDTAKFDHKLAA